MAVNRTDPENIEPVLGQGASLVKADDVDFTTNINAVRTYTEYSRFAQALNGERGSNGQSGRERRRNYNGDEVECTEQDGVPFDLRIVSSPVRRQRLLTPMRINWTALTAKPKPAMIVRTPMKFIESR